MPKNLAWKDLWGSLCNFIHIIERLGPEEVITLRPIVMLRAKAERIRTWKQREVKSSEDESHHFSLTDLSINVSYGCITLETGQYILEHGCAPQAVSWLQARMKLVVVLSAAPGFC